MKSGLCIPREKSSAPCGFPSSNKKDALRIAVVVEDLRLPLDEGAKRTCFNLIQGLIDKGVKVSVFTQYQNPLLKEAHQLPRNKFLLGNSFGGELRALSPDVILYMPASSGTIGAFVRAASIKAQSHGILLALLNLQYRNLPSFARYFGIYQCTDIVFTQSQASTDVYCSLGCKTVLLPGAVDHTRFQPVSAQEKRWLRSKYGFQDADQIILHIGHCNRERNVMTLAQMARSGFTMILIASTSTPIDHDLLTELKRAGVTVITDFIETIQHFYQLADCYLFPVFNSTSAIDAPLSILEAMACNLPIVTTQFGALPRMFESGEGFYYWDTDEELISLVKQAIVEPDCRTAEKVSPYTWDRAALTILETLKEAGV